MAPGRGLHPDFGGDSGEEDFPIYGFPFIVVEGSQPKLTVEFLDEDVRMECDGVDHNTNTSVPFYPVPAEAISMMGWVEGGLPGNVDQRDDHDRHILIVDKTNNTLYELYNVWYNGVNWEAYSGAFFDMKTNNRRPDGWTSADAAGLAILPGLVRYDEVYRSRRDPSRVPLHDGSHRRCLRLSRIARGRLHRGRAADGDAHAVSRPARTSPGSRRKCRRSSGP